MAFLFRKEGDPEPPLSFIQVSSRYRCTLNSFTVVHVAGPQLHKLNAQLVKCSEFLQDTYIKRVCSRLSLLVLSQLHCYTS